MKDVFEPAELEEFVYKCTEKHAHEEYVDPGVHGEERERKFQGMNDSWAKLCEISHTGISSIWV